LKKEKIDMAIFQGLAKPRFSGFFLEFLQKSLNISFKKLFFSLFDQYK